jgi:hypothetical protein
MRYKIVLFLLLFSFNLFSQEITGKWKAISFEDEIIYYNKINDSLSSKSSYSVEKLDSVKMMAEQLFLSSTFEFDTQNNYTIVGPMIGKLNGKFEVDMKNKRIKVTESNKKSDFWNYEFENDLLKIEMLFEDSFIKLGLVKI